MNPRLNRALFVILFPLAVVCIVLATIGEELWNTLVHIRLELRAEFESMRRIWRGME
jgi:hypothetical protein